MNNTQRERERERERGAKEGAIAILFLSKKRSDLLYMLNAFYEWN
jgi:hypothetical protein